VLTSPPRLLQSCKSKEHFWKKNILGIVAVSGKSWRVLGGMERMGDTAAKARKDTVGLGWVETGGCWGEALSMKQ